MHLMIKFSAFSVARWVVYMLIGPDTGYLRCTQASRYAPDRSAWWWLRQLRWGGVWWQFYCKFCKPILFFFVFRFFLPLSNLYFSCQLHISSWVELIEGQWAWSYSWLVARVANIALPWCLINVRIKPPLHGVQHKCLINVGLRTNKSDKAAVYSRYGSHICSTHF